MIAYVFLTYNPSTSFYNFTKKLKNDNTDIYICIDDNNYNIPNYKNDLNIIKINKNICIKNGYKGLVGWFSNSACSKDKAIYYFCEINKKKYDHIWFIEEDVFIPCVDTIKNIDKKYPNDDLLCAGNNFQISTDGQHIKKWCWYGCYYNDFEQNYDHLHTSMTCAIRCSYNLLKYIKEYAKKNKTLYMDEAFFTTIANQNKLNVNVINELKHTIVYQKKWNLKEINKYNLYHPIKDMSIQEFYRNKL